MQKITLTNKIFSLHEDACWKYFNKHYRKIEPDERIRKRLAELFFVKNPFINGVDRNAVEAYMQNQFKQITEGSWDKFNFVRVYENSFVRGTGNFKTWNRQQFIEKLGITTCPYCGTSYTISFKKENKQIYCDSQLDHYLPKKGNGAIPQLAMNIWNLIPVCTNCNHLKLDNPSAIINPYLDIDGDEIFFYVSPVDILNIVNGKNKDINIEVQAKNKIAQNHVKKLFLDKRYPKYQGIVKTLIEKKKKYPKSNLQNLANLLNTGNYNLETCLLKQDFFDDNEPFEKFKHDIWRQI